MQASAHDAHEHMLDSAGALAFVNEYSESAASPALYHAFAERKQVCPSTRLTYKEQRQLEALPERIEILEAEQTALHARLEDSELFHRDAAGFQATMERLPALDIEIQAAYARWDELERRQRESK